MNSNIVNFVTTTELVEYVLSLRETPQIPMFTEFVKYRGCKFASSFQGRRALPRPLDHWLCPWNLLGIPPKDLWCTLALCTCYVNRCFQPTWKLLRFNHCSHPFTQ